MSILSERLRTLRQTNNYTQKQIAELLSINPNSVQRFEYGTSRPSIDNLIILANHFNISIDYLLGLSDNPKINK